MKNIKLTLEERESKKPNQLRREGKIPGTMYGPGLSSRNVQVEAREFSRLPGAAFSHILTLEGLPDGTVNALIRHVQRCSTTEQVLNLEFYRVRADHKLTVTVPINLTGTSPAVSLGAQLIVGYQQAEIQCLPKDIPDSLEVDLGQLIEIDQAIHFKDLAIPPEVKLLNLPDEVIVKVVIPRVLEEEAPPAPIEGATPEGTTPEGTTPEGASPAAEGAKPERKAGAPPSS